MGVHSRSPPPLSLPLVTGPVLQLTSRRRQAALFMTGSFTTGLLATGPVLSNGSCARQLTSRQQQATFFTTGSFATGLLAPRLVLTNRSYAHSAVDQQTMTEHCTHLEKAVNLQLLGASAVIIIDTDNYPNIAIVTNTDKLNTLKETLRIPVGMIGKDEGQWLRDQLTANAPNSVWMHMDFLNPIKQAPTVRSLSLATC